MAEKLTWADIEKIKQEIEYRKLTVRPKLIEAVKEARAQGDLSENFEYYAAKREKNQNEGRIRYLEKMIRFAKVIQDTSAVDEVGLGKKVTLYIEEDDSIEEYKIVTPIRGNSLEGRVSIESPMGKALLGKKKEDRVFIDIGGGRGYYVVIKKIEIDDTDDDIRKF